MKLQIVVEGTYNDRWHRARKCVAGDLLETTAGYGQSLIDAGYASKPGSTSEEPATEEAADGATGDQPSEPSEEEAKPPEEEKPKPRRRSRAR